MSLDRVWRARHVRQGNAKIVDLGWMYLILPLLAGNCVCVLVASVFNNAIPGRQYPVFW